MTRKKFLELAFFLAIRYIMCFTIKYNRVTVTLNYVPKEKYL